MFRRRLLAGFLLLSLVSLSAQVREKETPASREENVRELLQKFNDSYQQKDVEGLSVLVTPDLTTFAGSRLFTSWEDFRDGFLYNTFSKNIPPSTWEIEKVETSPEMAWAYTKTAYNTKRDGQQVEADLYQSFVLQKRTSASDATAKSPSTPGWKIVLLSYTFRVNAPRNPQGQDSNPHPQNP